jgi:hypothetical protein
MGETEIKVDKIAGLDEGDPLEETLTPELHNARSADRGVAVVRLQDDSAYGMDRSNPQFASWRRFLSESEELGDPVFIEADAETRVVKTVLAPIRRRVRFIGPRDGERVRVVLLTAPSDFFLNSALLGEEKFETFYSLLKASQENDAEVLVTSYPATQEIVDVRDAGDAGGELEFVTEEVARSEPSENTLFGELSLLVLEDVISFDVARDEFRRLALRVDYIPFDYPFDCCTARAHEMCRILRRQGIRPEKVWNYGRNFDEEENTLVVITSSVGRVAWYYHVAPVVNVRFSNGDTERMVLDPSMFDGPVTVARWKARQNDAGAVHEFSPDRFYYRDPGGALPVFDEDYRKTRRLLSAHVRARGLLQS